MQNSQDIRALQVSSSDERSHSGASSASSTKGEEGKREAVISTAHGTSGGSIVPSNGKRNKSNNLFDKEEAIDLSLRLTHKFAQRSALLPSALSFLTWKRVTLRGRALAQDEKQLMSSWRQSIQRCAIVTWESGTQALARERRRSEHLSISFLQHHIFTWVRGASNLSLKRRRALRLRKNNLKACSLSAFIKRVILSRKFRWAYAVIVKQLLLRWEVHRWAAWRNAALVRVRDRNRVHAARSKLNRSLQLTCINQWQLQVVIERCTRATSKRNKECVRRRFLHAHEKQAFEAIIASAMIAKGHRICCTTTVARLLQMRKRMALETWLSASSVIDGRDDNSSTDRLKSWARNLMRRSFVRRTMLQWYVHAFQSNYLQRLLARFKTWTQHYLLSACFQEWTQIVSGTLYNDRLLAASAQPVQRMRRRHLKQLALDGFCLYKDNLRAFENALQNARPWSGTSGQWLCFRGLQESAVHAKRERHQMNKLICLYRRRRKSRVIALLQSRLRSALKAKCLKERATFLTYQAALRCWRYSRNCSKAHFAAEQALIHRSSGRHKRTAFRVWKKCTESHLERVVRNSENIPRWLFHVRAFVSWLSLSRSKAEQMSSRRRSLPQAMLRTSMTCWRRVALGIMHIKQAHNAVKARRDCFAFNYFQRALLLHRCWQDPMLDLRSTRAILLRRNIINWQNALLLHQRVREFGSRLKQTRIRSITCAVLRSMRQYADTQEAVMRSFQSLKSHQHKSLCVLFRRWAKQACAWNTSEVDLKMHFAATLARKHICKGRARVWLDRWAVQAGLTDKYQCESEKLQRVKYWNRGSLCIRAWHAKARCQVSLKMRWSNGSLSQSKAWRAWKGAAKCLSQLAAGLQRLFHERKINADIRRRCLWVWRQAFSAQRNLQAGERTRKRWHMRLMLAALRKQERCRKFVELSRRQHSKWLLRRYIDAWRCRTDKMREQHMEIMILHSSRSTKRTYDALCMATCVACSARQQSLYRKNLYETETLQSWGSFNSHMLNLKSSEEQLATKITKKNHVVLCHDSLFATLRSMLSMKSKMRRKRIMRAAIMRQLKRKSMEKALFSLQKARMNIIKQTKESMSKRQLRIARLRCNHVLLLHTLCAWSNHKWAAETLLEAMLNAHRADQCACASAFAQWKKQQHKYMWCGNRIATWYAQRLCRARWNILQWGRKCKTIMRSRSWSLAVRHQQTTRRQLMLLCKVATQAHERYRALRVRRLRGKHSILFMQWRRARTLRHIMSSLQQQLKAYACRRTFSRWYSDCKEARRKQRGEIDIARKRDRSLRIVSLVAWTNLRKSSNKLERPSLCSWQLRLSGRETSERYIQAHLRRSASRAVLLRYVSAFELKYARISRRAAIRKGERARQCKLIFIRWRMMRWSLEQAQKWRMERTNNCLRLCKNYFRSMQALSQRARRIQETYHRNLLHRCYMIILESSKQNAASQSVGCQPQEADRESILNEWHRGFQLRQKCARAVGKLRTQLVRRIFDALYHERDARKTLQGDNELYAAVFSMKRQRILMSWRRSARVLTVEDNSMSVARTQQIRGVQARPFCRMRTFLYNVQHHRCISGIERKWHLWRVLVLWQAEIEVVIRGRAPVTWHFKQRGIQVSANQQRRCINSWVKALNQRTLMQRLKSMSLLLPECFQKWSDRVLRRKDAEANIIHREHRRAAAKMLQLLYQAAYHGTLGSGSMSYASRQSYNRRARRALNALSMALSTSRSGTNACDAFAEASLKCHAHSVLEALRAAQRRGFGSRAAKEDFEKKQAILSEAPPFCSLFKAARCHKVRRYIEKLTNMKKSLNALEALKRANQLHWAMSSSAKGCAEAKKVRSSKQCCFDLTRKEQYHSAMITEMRKECDSYDQLQKRLVHVQLRHALLSWIGLEDRIILQRKAQRRSSTKQQLIVVNLWDRQYLKRMRGQDRYSIEHFLRSSLIRKEKQVFESWRFYVDQRCSKGAVRERQRIWLLSWHQIVLQAAARIEQADGKLRQAYRRVLHECDELESRVDEVEQQRARFCSNMNHEHHKDDHYLTIAQVPVHSLPEIPVDGKL